MMRHIGIIGAAGVMIAGCYLSHHRSDEPEVPDADTPLTGVDAGPPPPLDAGPLDAAAPEEVLPADVVRRISPLVTERALGTRVRFRWQATPEIVISEIIICAERSCDEPERHLVAGTELEVELPAGVYRWSVRGGDASGAWSVPARPWWFRVEPRREGVGEAWGGVADVNCDEIPDLVVGRARPAVALGRGDASFGSPITLERPEDERDAGTRFGNSGRAVRDVGDVNGDGCTDVMIGVWGASVAGPAGRAWLYLGGETFEGSGPLAVAPPELDSDGLGWMLAGAGDVDGDGYSDVLMAGGASSDGISEAVLYRGGPSGLTASMHLTRPDLSRFGTAVGGGVDLDDDGFDDVIVTTWGGFESYVVVYHGSPDGLVERSTRLSTQPPLDVAVGDFDGDGRGDFAVPSIEEDRAVEVYLAATVFEPVSVAPVRADVDGGGSFELTLSSVGDVDGDGGDDLVYLRRWLSFHDTWWAGVLTLSAGTASWRSVRDRVNAIGGVSDLDGDGRAEIVVGSDTTEVVFGTGATQAVPGITGVRRLQSTR